MRHLLLLLLLGQNPSDPSGPISADPHELQAVIETPVGEVVIEFYPDAAPAHVAQFIRLVEEDFYDGTTFHSMVPTPRRSPKSGH